MNGEGKAAINSIATMNNSANALAATVSGLCTGEV